MSQDGDMLAEMFMLSDKVVGLSRHFNRTGCVAYLVQDLNEARINHRFYNQLGELVTELALAKK